MATGALMLYLKSLSLSKFKSFKNAELLFSKGFTCIVGPNGSGKSNICDALLFSLGESSLKRMRVDKLDLLINGSPKAKGGVIPTTHVKATFDGDEKVEVVRAARADGKSFFKVNGKKMTRHEVLEILKSHKVHIDETNTITQGEILKMMDLNPKERRELIDIASGITEFESKKKESLKELEKVNIKLGEVQAILSERLGYIKELEKEKEAAESYSNLTSRQKLLKYNILVSREEEIKQSFDKHTKEMALLDSKKQKLLAELEELNTSIAKLTSDRAQLTKEFSESSNAAGEESRKLENINKELALVELGMQNNEKQSQEKSAQASAMNDEIGQINKTVAQNKAELSIHQKRILELEPFFANLKEETLEAKESKISKLNENITKLEEEFGTAQETISALNADLSATKNSIVEFSARKESLQNALKEKLAEKKQSLPKLDEISSRSKKYDAQIAKSEQTLREISEKVEDIDTKALNLKEQRAIATAREGSLGEKLSQNFKEKDGLYGKVSQLCTYPSDYSLAIEASAGGRFDYFVVESIESASKMISYLKKNELGRATFIPIRDLSYEKDKRKDANLKPILDVVKFDPKFERVFEYVFSNTYLIDKVEDSKVAGIGRHRYVTISGELVEQSGVLSGGHQRRRLSIASIENGLKELSLEKEKASSKAKELGEELNKARKEKALSDMEFAKISSHSSDLESQISELEKEEGKLTLTLKSYESKLKELESQISKGADKKERAAISLENSRKEVAEFYKALEAQNARGGMSKQQKLELNLMRTELQGLNVKAAELATQSQMLEKRRAELEGSISSLSNSIQELKQDTKDKLARKASYEKARKELEERIKNSSTSSKKAYSQLEQMDLKLGKLNADKGKTSAESDSIERSLNEIKMKRNSYEVRLADIQAELATYTISFERLKMGIEEMEKESTYVAVKIEQLGNVNLKAPEIYLSKKADVEEADSRLQTLVIEKDAILKMIEEIDSKKLRIFMETFEIVNTNFTKLYNYIFPGKASIELENIQNPFDSGLHIKMVDGKTIKREHSLSGGEKSLVMLMLLFSIHMHKPSSLYIFDEVDTALDKENSKKLSSLIKQMSQGSQFIVVSHNDSLIVNSDTAIGVSKQEGESKAVGLQIASLAKQGA